MKRGGVEGPLGRKHAASLLNPAQGPAHGGGASCAPPLSTTANRQRCRERGARVWLWVCGRESRCVGLRWMNKGQPRFSTTWLRDSETANCTSSELRARLESFQTQRAWLGEPLASGAAIQIVHPR